VLGLWLSSECFGLMAKFGILGIYEYFPSFRLAEEQTNGATLFRNLGWLQLVVAFFFLVFFVVDCFFYYFHPF